MSKTSQAAAVPALAPGMTFSDYYQRISRIPMLSEEEEFQLARDWRDNKDPEAAKRLVTSHLRLVAKIAMGYRNYGLPIADLVAEGTVGMMLAVRKFDPERKFRLSTYARWWIHAQIKEFVLRSWSMVKVGTTAAQKKLFFNLRQLKNNLEIYDNKDLEPEQVKQIAGELSVKEEDVVSMNQRMAGGDRSLNVPVSIRSEGEAEWQDWIEDESDDQETAFAEREEDSVRRQMMNDAMKQLDARQRDIIRSRNMREVPLTLDVLAKKYDISRERVRQIEAEAVEKMTQIVRARVAESGQLEQV